MSANEIVQDQTRSTRLTLSRPFSDLLVELSIALHKFVMYPKGHPSLAPAAASVVRKAARIMEDRATIAFGVARHQLIIEGVATDPTQPVLRRLAEGLNGHHLGAVSISQGITPEEIAEALQALAADPTVGGRIGLRSPDLIPSWAHLRLYPLTFDRLGLMVDAPVTPRTPADSASRAVDLWLGLARAAMTREQRPPDDDSVPIEPAAVARAIDEPGRAEAYDQVIVGYLLQIARELKDTTGLEASALRRRTGRLIAALKPDTLRRLVDMSGDVRQRRTLVLDAVHGMAVESALDILKAAADASNQTISHGLVRMFSKLGMHAEQGPAAERELASAALHDQVGRLLSGWELADPNPSEYSQKLQRVATGTPLFVPRATTRAIDDRDPIRLVQISLEVGTAGILLERTIDRAVNEGRVGDVLDLLMSAPSGANPARDAIVTRLAHPDTFARVAGRDPIDAVVLDRLLLLPGVSLEAYGVLLDALANCEQRRSRRLLLDRLVRPPVDLAPLILERLSDERWFVQRNLLILLTRSGCTPATFSAEPWTTHPHPHVRYEAIRLQLTLPAEWPLALRTALGDDDPRVIRLGLSAVQHCCPADVLTLVTRVAADAGAPEQLRTLALRALGRSREPQALDTLLAAVDGGTTLLGMPRAPVPTPPVLAALRALTEGWSSAPRARAVLALAKDAADPALRHTVRRHLP